jgi:hypothetical protein
MLASNVRYGEPSAFGIRLRVEQKPSLKPRHMQSCNVRVLPNPRVTLWFRCGVRRPSARHRFNVKDKRRGAVARALPLVQGRTSSTRTEMLMFRADRLSCARPPNCAMGFLLCAGRASPPPVTLPSCRIPRRRPEAAGQSHQDHIDRRCQGPARAHRACTARHSGRRGR